MGTPVYSITYEFRFEDGSKQEFCIELDPDRVTIIQPEQRKKAEWTRLEYRQCSCCSLSPESTLYCPIAVNIADLVEAFKDVPSFNRCTVWCTTPERSYMKETDVQEGLFSIFGIIMATSNCPDMELFRPMARFHLPFATSQETVLRLSAVHFLRQYFQQKNGNAVQPVMNLQSLNEHYQRVQEVNKGFFERIKNVSRKDADKNAIIILNSLAQIMTMELDDGLESLQYLFPEK